MITQEQLIESSRKIDIMKFINDYIEKKIQKELNEEKRNKLIQAYNENWGETLSKWADKAGDFFGKMKSNADKNWDSLKNNWNAAGDTFTSKYQQHNKPPQNFQLQMAKRAYEILNKAGLLADSNLKKSLETIKSDLEGRAIATQKQLPFPENLNFKGWLLAETALPKHYRPELQEPQIKKFEVNVGDIVEMGPETEHMGQSINRIAQVVEIREKEAVLKDLTRSSAKKQVVPLSDLHDKEELRGMRVIPKEEAQLKALGGKRLWVRLTPRQYKKYASQYRAEKVPEIIPMAQDDDKSSDLLKRMFSTKSTEDRPEELLPMFSGKKQQGDLSPLRRFLAAKKGIL